MQHNSAAVSAGALWSMRMPPGMYHFVAGETHGKPEVIIMIVIDCRGADPSEAVSALQPEEVPDSATGPYRRRPPTALPRPQKLNFGLSEFLVCLLSLPASSRGITP